MNKALFVTIDETLITPKSGKGFPINSDDWKFKTNFYDLFKTATDKGYLIVLIDNQLSIGQGFVSEQVFISKLENICSIIEKDLFLEKNSIIYTYCPSNVEAFKVKPNPGLLYDVALDYDIVLKYSILIGNCEEDKRFSLIGGIDTYYELRELPFITL